MPVAFNATAIPGPTITGTTAGAPGNNALATEVVKATFDKVIAFKSRQEPMLRKFATVRPVDIAYPGSSIDLFMHGSDLALATTPLDEYQDPDFVSLPAPTKVTLTLNEYGNATVTTMRLREFSFSQINPLQAELIGRNMRDTLDKLVETVILGSSNKQRVTATGIASGAATYANIQNINSKAIRRVVAQMRSNNALEFGSHYMAIVHPDVCVDLREETDAAGWRAPHTYAENANSVIWNGEVGVYEGCRFVEYNRAPQGTVVDGANTKKRYTSLILGQEGIAEAVAVEGGTTVTPTSDKFGRLMGLGWFFFGGWCLYRPEALTLVESTSSV
jgi:N4-gp56 family major capsid protein